MSTSMNTSISSSEIPLLKRASLLRMFFNRSPRSFAAFSVGTMRFSLASSFGVYLMHDEKDEIIYVGKAISLKNRVRQYFQSSRNKGVKIEQMVTHITRFEYIVTDSELEALVLECNLIKEHRPKYNTMLMDDKAYPFIKVTVDEAFPRIMMARRMVKDKAKYFGPYTSAGAVKDTIELIRKLYKVRSCNRRLPRSGGVCQKRICGKISFYQGDLHCRGGQRTVSFCLGRPEGSPG